MTNTRSPGAPAGQCMDEDYFTVYPRYIDIWVLFHGVYTYIVDKDAGAYMQYEGTLTENPVYCYYYFWPGGLEENDQSVLNLNGKYATIFNGPLQLSEDQNYKIFDITGRQIHTLNPAPGIYFVEIEGKIKQKVVKIK